MCVDVDEPWEVVNSWRATAKCEDCGWVGPGWTEERAPEVDGFECDYGRGLRAVELLFNDGVPDWSIDEDTFDPWGADADLEWQDRALALAALLPVEIEGTGHVCDNCIEARRWLEVWCHSFWYSRYLDDIFEHWEEDGVTRSVPMARLAVAARNRWKIHGRRLRPDEAKRLVDDSLRALQAQVAA